MAKPVTLPLWATDTTNTTIGSVEVGQTVKLEPSTGVKQQGWIAGEEAPARWMNWWQNLVYAWAVYLDGLATDAQFLANGFEFTGDNVFDGTSLFNGTVTAQDVYLDGAVTSITNEATYPVAKTRKKHAVLVPTYGWEGAPEESIRTITTTNPSWQRLPMPEGATLQTVVATVFQGTTPAAVSMAAQVYLVSTVANNDNTRSAQGSAATWGLGNGFKDLVPSFTPFTPSSDQWAAVRIMPSDAAASLNDAVVRVTYTYSELRASGS